MSRKLINVLTFFSIVLGEIYILYISIFAITNFIVIDKKSMVIFIFIYLIPSYISYMRKRTIVEDKFIPNKKDIKIFLAFFIIFLVLAILIYISPIQNIKDRTISIYITVIFVNIYYIVAHFNSIF